MSELAAVFSFAFSGKAALCYSQSSSQLTTLTPFQNFTAAGISAHVDIRTGSGWLSNVMIKNRWADFILEVFDDEGICCFSQRRSSSHYFSRTDQLTGLAYQPTVVYVCVDRRVSAADADVYVPVWLWQSWRRSMFQFVSATTCCTSLAASCLGG